MSKFMDKDFLLYNDTAKRLYHEVAEKLPIIDYHCHIPPQQIAEDTTFSSITEVWLGGDHYKWRLVRTNGASEELVTGQAPDREKFRAFAEVMPKLIGNPIHHWSHLELQRCFDIYEPLNAKNCDHIFDEANEQLKNCSVRQLMKKFDVKAVCTTDDPIDDLRWHKQIAEDESFSIKVLPAFRPDKAVNVDKEGFAAYIAKLSEVTGREIGCTQDVIVALCDRIDYFSACGCLCADHGLDYVMFERPELSVADQAFAMAMKGEIPDASLTDAYKTAVVIACAKAYADHGWVMQIHFGCLRNNNKLAFALQGPDHGYDAINSQSHVENLAPLLNAFVENEGLPKMIFYSLSPNDNSAIVSIMQCFQGDGVPGKLNHGTGWWFNDNLEGMRKQMIELAQNGVFGRFLGMLTDSRSFLSYTRHEYFRRILCQLIGEWVESGQYPDDEELLAELVRDICFNNTNEFFGFGV